MTPDPAAAPRRPPRSPASTDLAAARGAFQGSRIAARMPSEPGTPGATSNWADAQQTAPPQSAPTHFGYVQDASTHGTFSNNGDGGPELATADDVAGLHSRFDELSGQVGNMASSGAGQAQGNANMQQLTPSRMPDRPASVSPLAASAAAREAANQQAAGAQQLLQAGQQRTMATFQQRQAQGGMRSMQPTGNAMGQTTSQASMAGLLGRQVGGGVSANGQSESTFANTFPVVAP